MSSVGEAHHNIVHQYINLCAVEDATGLLNLVHFRWRYLDTQPCDNSSSSLLYRLCIWIAFILPAICSLCPVFDLHDLREKVIIL